MKMNYKKEFQDKIDAGVITGLIQEVQIKYNNLIGFKISQEKVSQSQSAVKAGQLTNLCFFPL